MFSKWWTPNGWSLADHLTMCLWTFSNCLHLLAHKMTNHWSIGIFSAVLVCLWFDPVVFRMHIHFIVFKCSSGCTPDLSKRMHESGNLHGNFIGRKLDYNTLHTMSYQIVLGCHSQVSYKRVVWLILLVQIALTGSSFKFIHYTLVGKLNTMFGNSTG